MNSQPLYGKMLGWSKLAALTGSTQLLVQGLGFVSGLMIIRLLPTHEYALYTLANTMLGTMTMLADSGISNGVMAEGGKVWQDRNKLGAVLATGLSLRKKFGIASMIATLPVLAYLLLDHGASWLMTIMIILSIIPAFLAALTDSLLVIAPKLHQDIKSLQQNQAEVSLGRMVLSVGLLFIFPFTFVALIANSIPRIYGNFKLQKFSARYTSTKEAPDQQVQASIGRAVKRTFPIVLYHCLSGQVSIWLISFFGTTANIAQLGALGRISMIFTLFTVVFSTLIAPRFSRMPAQFGNLMKYFLSIQAGVFMLCVLIFAFINLSADVILLVFGSEYSGLNYELSLVALSGCIGMMVSVVSQLSIGRGWFIRTYILIAFNFVTTILGFAVFNIQSLEGVLCLNVLNSSVHFIIVFVYGLISMGRMKTKATANAA